MSQKILPFACLAFLITSFFSLASMGQDAELKKYGVSFNPLGLIFLSVDAKAQFTMSDHFALVVPAVVQYMWESERNFFGTKIRHSVNRFHSGIGFRWNLSDTIGKSSWYLEPKLNLGLTTFLTEKYFAMSPSVLFGYNWAWSNGFNMSLGLGGQWEFLLGKEGPNLKAFKQLTKLPFIMFPLTGEFSIGWLF